MAGRVVSRGAGWKFIDAGVAAQSSKGQRCTYGAAQVFEPTRADYYGSHSFTSFFASCICVSIQHRIASYGPDGRGTRLYTVHVHGPMLALLSLGC
jgi:hypothetical protein